MRTLEELQNEILSEDLEELIGEEIKKQNEQRLDKLIEYGISGKLVPVIGSGLSNSYKIPTWNNLTGFLFPVGLNSIYRDVNDNYTIALNNINDKNLQQLIKEGIINKTIVPPTIGDPLEYAEYIHMVIKQHINREERERDQNRLITGQELDKCTEPHFRSEVQKALLSIWQNENKRMRPDKMFNDIIKPYISREDTALSHIANFVAEKSLDVITYNFDNILELLLEIKSASNPSIKVHSISNNKQMRENWADSDINIYHVHGRICFEKDTNESEDGKLIFAESQYYEAEHYLYDWLHAIQADQLHKRHMMFVGFSGQDYNFKRIFKNLKINSEDPPAHYIFLPLEDFISDIRIDDCYKQKKDPKGNENAQIERILKGIINNTMFMKELYFQSHGLLPIWICYKKLDEYMKKMEDSILNYTTP